MAGGAGKDFQHRYTIGSKEMQERVSLFSFCFITRKVCWSDLSNFLYLLVRVIVY